MSTLSSLKWVQSLNVAITATLLGAVIWAFIPAESGGGEPSEAGIQALPAAVFGFYLFYIALSSLVTRKIFGRFEFVERDTRPFEFWLYFVLYLFVAVMFLIGMNV